MVHGVNGYIWIKQITILVWMCKWLVHGSTVWIYMNLWNGDLTWIDMDMRRARRSSVPGAVKAPSVIRIFGADPYVYLQIFSQTIKTIIPKYSAEMPGPWGYLKLLLVIYTSSASIASLPDGMHGVTWGLGPGSWMCSKICASI